MIHTWYDIPVWVICKVYAKFAAVVPLLLGCLGTARMLIVFSSGEVWVGIV